MDQMLRKNEELGAILEVSRVLTKSFDLENNLISVMKTLATRLEMQRACVFLLHPHTKEIRIVAAHGLNREEIERGKYRIGEGVVGKVIETAEPMYIPNIGEEPLFLNKTDSRPHKSGISFYCIPIAIDGNILGVLSVDRIYTQERGEVDDDLRVLHIIGSFIAQFIKLWDNYKRTQIECGNLRSQLEEKFSLPNIIGESTQFQQVLKSIRKVAATDTTVMLLGESGTGKELIAQTLHYQSRRVTGPFVAVNLAALPENLIEAELFGVEKGAYTGAGTRRIGRFENADQGTLFLDEVGELPLSIQVKLLRVLQERTFERVGSSSPIKVDLRVVTATNRNLMDQVRKGSFREDLYWRLHVVPIVLPPLRDRASDIPLLIDYYINKFNRMYLREVLISKAALARLSSYAWPGNVRELANTVERLVVMAENNLIQPEDLPLYLRGTTESALVFQGATDTRLENLGDTIEAIERREIIKALKENNLIQQRAAQTLGITARQLGYRIKKYEIEIRSI